jgi:hypothetical protein
MKVISSAEISVVGGGIGPWPLPSPPTATVSPVSIPGALTVEQIIALASGNLWWRPQSTM